MRQLVLDIQTTGFAPEEGHRVVEVAVVEMIDRKLTGRSFHRYLNPHRDMDPAVIQRTGITPDFLKAQPHFEDIAGALVEYVRGAELLIHNSAYQLAFIDAEMRRAGNKLLSATCPKIVDTLSLATKLHPEDSNSIDSLTSRYNVKLDDSRFLGGLHDAALLAQVYIKGFASLRLDLPKEMASSGNIWTPDMERELLVHLRRNPAALFELTPRRFEELIASIFRNNGFVVELTPQTRDGGVDIIAVQHSFLTGDLVHLIECKRYKESRSVGIGTVQRLLGTVVQQQATRGIVVATSHFTREAKRVAEESRHLITLNDYHNIVGWLGDRSRD